MNRMQQPAADISKLSAAQMQKQQEQQEEMKEQVEAQKQAMEEQRNTILRASLEPQAFERLRRVALVKPDKARAAQDYIFQLIKRGVSQGNLIDEATVISILEKVSEASSTASNSGKIQFRRKRLGSEDEADDF